MLLWQKSSLVLYNYDVFQIVIVCLVAGGLGTSGEAASED